MALLTDLITVWTIHPIDFDLLQPGLGYDHECGNYWNCRETRRRYREVLPYLHRVFAVDEILWCLSSLVGWWMSEFLDNVAWELEVPTSLILAHFDENAWGRVVKEPSDTPLDLSILSLPKEYPIKNKCEVLVRWPLGPDCKITKRGSLRRNGQIDEAFFEQLRAGQASTH